MSRATHLLLPHSFIWPIYPPLIPYFSSYLPIHPSIQLTTRLTIYPHPFTYLPINLFTHFSVTYPPPMPPSFYSLIHPLVHLPILPFAPTHSLAHPPILSSVCLPIHRSTHLSFFLCIYSSIGLSFLILPSVSAHPPILPSMYLHIHWSIHLSFHLWTHLLVHPPFLPSIYLLIHSSVRLSIHLSNNLFTYPSTHSFIYSLTL